MASPVLTSYNVRIARIQALLVAIIPILGTKDVKRLPQALMASVASNGRRGMKRAGLIYEISYSSSMTSMCC
jgi:hypothetical protein